MSMSTKAYVFGGTQEQFDEIRSAIGGWCWNQETQERFGEYSFKQEYGRYYIRDILLKVYEFDTIDYSVPRKTTFTNHTRSSDWVEIEKGDIVFRWNNLSAVGILKPRYGIYSLERNTN